MRRGKAEADPLCRIARYGDVTMLSFLAERYPSERMDAVADAMAEAAGEGAGLLVLDFTRVEWASSTVFRPIAFGLKDLRARGGRFAAAGGGPLVKTVIGFLPDLTRFETCADAIASLSEEARTIYGREEGQR